MFLYSLRINLLCIHFYRIACSYFFILTIFILTICNSRGQEGNPNPVIGREMQRSLMIYLLTIFAGGGRDGDTTIPTVRMVLGGGVLGWPCGRAGHPVGIYTHP